MSTDHGNETGPCGGGRAGRAGRARIEHRPAEEPLGQIFNVLTLRDARIVRIEDFRGRSEALTAAGVAEDEDSHIEKYAEQE